MRVSNNKVVADFKLFEEFCRVVEKSIIDRKFVHIAFDGSTFSLHSEGSISSVYLRLPVSDKAEPFTAGVDADKFLASFKKLYQGDVTLKLNKSKVELTKDNIKIRFPVVSGRSYVEVAQGLEVIGARKDWLIENLIACVLNLEETGKKVHADKFIGVLFETIENSSRLVKFSQAALYLASNIPLFEQPYRVLIPDILAVVAKALKKDVEAVIFLKTKIGLRFKHGVEVYVAIPYDTYPQEYISTLGLVGEGCMIPEGTEGYTFKKDELFNAVDLVATTLGDAESWISLSTVGRSGDSLVWEVAGKAYNGVEASEKLLSSHGSIVKPFAVNKKRMLRCMSSFGETIHLYDLSRSALALADDSGSQVALLIKAVI